MPGSKLVVPVLLPWAGRAPPVQTREATVRGGPSTSTRLVVPVLLRADSAQTKTKKAKRKAKTQWGDFNRQAKRRGKAVTLQPGTYMLLVSICVYGRGFLAFVFGCLSFQINVVLKRLELDSYWALNEGETDAHLWNDRAGTEAIDPAH